MAKKKAARAATKKAGKKSTAKTASRKKAAKKASQKKPAAKKKASKTSAKKKPQAKKASRLAAGGAARMKKKAAARQPAAKKRAKKRPPRLKANERLEKMTVEIQKQHSGDLVVTESAGGAIKVHHTVHPGAEQTPIPGSSYDDLKELGAGAHEIEVKRSVEMPSGNVD